MIAPLTLFIWSKNRIVPVRLTDFSITEEAFDPELNPIRAKVSLGMRVLNVDDLGFDARAAACSWLSAAEGKTRGAKPRRGVECARHRRHSMSDPLQSSCCKDRRSRTVSAEQPLRRHRNRHAEHGGRKRHRVSAPAVRAAAGALRLAAGIHRRRRRPARQSRRANSSAIRSSSGESATRTRAMRPEELTEIVGRAIAHHAAGRNPGNAKCLKGINLTLMIGPVVPVPVSQEMLDALTSVM